MVGPAVALYVVLEREGDAVERAAHDAPSALRVARAGLGERAGVQGEKRVETRSASVVGGDAREIVADEILRRERAVGESRLEAGEIFLSHRESRRRRLGRPVRDLSSLAFRESREVGRADERARRLGDRGNLRARRKDSPDCRRASERAARRGRPSVGMETRLEGRTTPFSP